MGGTKFKKYNTLSKEIWQWAEQKHIFLFASYITSADIFAADKLSRLKNGDTERELCDYAFKKIVQAFGEPTIYLFATNSTQNVSVFSLGFLITKQKK